MDIEKQLKTLIDGITKQVIASVKSDIAAAMETAIAEHSAKFDELTVEAFGRVIKENLRKIDFPDGSIPLTALNFEKSKLTGDNIRGGIIESFGSIGIEDRAQSCQVTILEKNTVVENNLISKSLTVKNNVVIEGDLIVKGEVPTDSPMFQKLVDSTTTKVINGIDHDLFTDYGDIVIESIRKDGLDLSKISLNGKEVIKDNQLGTSITSSSLQSVGILKQLQVSGESFLSETLYSSQKRVGINTMNPSATFSVWDEEVELQIGKRVKDTVWLNTPRSHKVVISSDGNENITCHSDGSVEIKNELRMGTMTFSTSDKAPGHESRKGVVVFNANPSLGGPLGWVCLGGAKWANFGIID